MNVTNQSPTPHTLRDGEALGALPAVLPFHNAAVQNGGNSPLLGQAKTQSPSVFPQEVKIMPVLVMDAARASHGGAIRAWILARALDQARSGSGAVAASDLHQYLSSLGVNERTCRRWIAAAVELGLLIPFRRTRSRVSGFRYLSPDRAALQVGCPHLGSRPVAVSARKLVRPGWKSIVWAGFVATLGERPASRETKRCLTGVPKQTQLHLESRIPIQKTANYVVSDMPATHLTGVREFQRPHAFSFRKADGQIVIAWRGPDSCSIPEYVAKTLNKGRIKKANKRLNAESNAVWLNVEPALSEEKADTGKLFFAKLKDAERRIRRLTRPHAPQGDVEEVFVAIPKDELFTPQAQPRARFWQQVRVYDR